MAVGKAIRLARERREKLPFAPTGKAGGPPRAGPHLAPLLDGEGSRKDPEKARPLLKWIPATLVNRELLPEAGAHGGGPPAVARKVKA